MSSGSSARRFISDISGFVLLLKGFLCCSMALVAYSEEINVFVLFLLFLDAIKTDY